MEKGERKDCKVFCGNVERRLEKQGRKSEKTPLDETSLGQVWRIVIFLVLVAQNWLCVTAAAEGLQKRTEMMERWQHQEVQVKECGWAEEISQRWK